jgi:hypothetical protein
MRGSERGTHACASDIRERETHCPSPVAIADYSSTILSLRSCSYCMCICAHPRTTTSSFHLDQGSQQLARIDFY